MMRCFLWGTLAVSFCLGGCGGGQSETDQRAEPAPVVTPVQPVTPPVMAPEVPSVQPKFTYADPALLSMANALNLVRTTSGAGNVIQKSALDLAAKRHADYLVNNGLTSNGAYLYAPQENGQWGGHYESMANLGFSGATPQARADVAAYLGAVNELLVFGAKSVAECVASLENSAYHLIHLLSPYVDMGIYFNAGNGGESACIVLLGVANSSTGQFAPVNSYVFYPSNMQRNVPPVFFNQAERPIAAPDLPLTGHPILMSFYNQSHKVLAARDLLLHAFEVYDAAGKRISVRVLTFPGVQSDGPPVVADANVAAPGYIVALPVQPLMANSTYQIKVSADVAGQNVTQNWSFVTGTAN